MKKKSAKKLVISRETVRELSESQTGQAAGGYPVSMVEDTCWKSYCFCPPPPQ